jgi:hypothetical protein
MNNDRVTKMVGYPKKKQQKWSQLFFFNEKNHWPLKKKIVIDWMDSYYYFFSYES